MTIALLCSISVALLIGVILICNLRLFRNPFAAGPWHDLKHGHPLAGIPVLTEYVNAVGKYHGFRVDTYSIKQGVWVEANAWDQEVIRYADIKQS